MATPGANLIGLTADPLINGLIQGSAWTFTGPRVLTYSFNLNFDYTGEGQPVAGQGGTWAESPAIQGAVERALASWAAVANLSFSNITSGSYAFESTADIALALTGSDLQQGFGAAALGFFPDPGYATDTLTEAGYTRNEYPGPEGDVLIDNFYAGFQYLQDGGFGLWALIHELGHALGLKHPFDDGGNARPTYADTGNSAWDAERFTVMSYSGVGNLPAGHAATPMPLDILAIQHIYGANMAYRTANDVYQPTLDGAMRTIWDAGGVDTLDASSLGAAVALDLRPGSLMFLPLSTVLGIAYNCTIENAMAGSGNDTLDGNSAANAMDGGSGNDRLDGADNNDNLSGGLGFDSLLGGQGNDTLRGGEQADTLRGGDGDDLLNGGKGTDSLEGGAGNDTLIGALGTDLLNGGDGIDTADYSASTDGVTVSLLVSTAQQVSIATGLDTLLFVENLIGSVFHDALTGTTGNNTITGGFGNDTLTGDAGFDSLDGGEGNDSLSGGLNADTVQGGAGNDFVSGGQGTDSLVGGEGDDTLVGGLGTDRLVGGAGADRYVFKHALDGVVNIDTIADLVSGEDVVELSASIFTALAGSKGLMVGPSANLTYDSTSGLLTYDGDGVGPGAAVPFAVVGVHIHPMSLGNDFLVVA